MKVIKTKSYIVALQTKYDYDKYDYDVPAVRVLKRKDDNLDIYIYYNRASIHVKIIPLGVEK